MIEIENLWKSFNSNQVLTGLQLNIHDGESLVVIGKSGSGKSVLLKLMIGLLKPERGKIRIEREDIVGMGFRDLQKIRRRFGFVFQAAALFDSLTVAENVGLALRKFFHYSEGKIEHRIRECLAFVDLEGAENKYPAELSGGMKKRVGVARAIATYPQYILFDEPTTGLDPETAENINQLIVKLKNEMEVTSVVVTHDMHSAFTVGDRIVLLHDGKIEVEGSPTEIRKMVHPEVQKFLIGYTLNQY
ncbi:ABC transporter ATP-binding protein [candidate division KSB1 bacterium 4484_188]|nr:MAG: ABC transporter ATP-binding protein [candidate division KSB1 bacterium 4484_188]HFE64036.1 ABC transporter ATP-binding protein [Caldithrix sp.]